MQSPWRFAWLVVPLISAGMALATGRLPWKLGVPACCGAILLSQRRRVSPRCRLQVGAVVFGFALSMVGDYFLSSRRGHAHYFEAGIAAFLLAHLGYLAYALANGRLHWGALSLLLAGFVPYFILGLAPAIPAPGLWVAVLLYLLVSCVGFAAAWGLRVAALPRGLFIAGIGLIVFSDTLISFSEFLRWSALNAWILPTYYLAHLALSSSLLARTDLFGWEGDPEGARVSGGG